MTVLGAVRRIPAWFCLVAIVVCSAGARILLGHQVVAPWIMVDELIYSELARSFAATGHFQIRGVSSSGYGFVYPMLIAPAWRLFGSMPRVYAVAKGIGAVTMSLAAVPAYFLARRLLGPWLALTAALLTVLVPSMLYTGELMTENAFYPLFLAVCFALVVTLERPTPLRQVGVLVLCGLAYATRQQAIALVPAVAVAPALHGWIERDVRGRLRAWRTLYAILAACVVVVLAGTVARGRSPLSLLGAYRSATSVPYSAGSILHYLLWHVAELDLYVGIVPFAALLAIWFAPRATSPAVRAFTAATLPITVLLVVEVAIFASTQSGRIEERNMFYVAPFGLIALLGLAARDVVPRVRPALLAAAAIAGVLPVAIPFAKFVTTGAVSDTFALLPWWWVQDRGIHFGTLRFVALGVGIVAALLFLVVPRRFALALAVLVASYFVVTTAVVQNGRHGIRQAAVGNLWAGIKTTPLDWIDHAAGRNADVTIVQSSYAPEPVWDNEFFNRSVHRVVALGDVFTGGLPEPAVHERADGTLVQTDGAPLQARYALVSGLTAVAGKTVAADPAIGLELVRVDGPVVVLTKITGLYSDSWSGRTVDYTRRLCTGGYVSVELQSDPNLYAAAQLVTATVDGHPDGQIRVPPSGDAIRFVVPLERGAGNLCTVRFTMATLREPAKVEGSSDTRALGTRFLRFQYLK